MSFIETSLTTSGNSTAVRLPKELLRMSGLGKKVRLEAKEGQIIITRSDNPRKDWGETIKKLTAEHGDPAREFSNEVSPNEGLINAPWER